VLLKNKDTISLIAKVIWIKTTIYCVYSSDTKLIILTEDDDQFSNPIILVVYHINAVTFLQYKKNQGTSSDSWYNIVYFEYVSELSKSLELISILCITAQGTVRRWISVFSESSLNYIVFFVSFSSLLKTIQGFFKYQLDIL